MADPSTHPPMTVSRLAGACGQHHNNLYELQQSSCLTDFTIKVGDKCVPCHKVVIAAASPYFGAMMRSEMKETQSAETNLDNFSPKVIEAIIQYLYTFTISVEYEDVEGVIEAANFLQLPDLKKHCENYIKGELNVYNVIGWCKVGTALGIDSLVVQAKELLWNDFLKIAKNDEFKNLTITELIDLVTDDDAKIHNYDSLLNACLDWIKYDLTDRQEHLMNMIPKLSIEKCSVDGLKYMIQANRDVISHESELYIFHLKLDQNKSKKTYVQNIVLHGGCELTNSFMWTCCNSDFSWNSLKQTSTPAVLKTGNICPVADGLFMTGGKNIFGGLSNNAHLFNAKYNNWLELPKMHTPRTCHGAACVGNFVYVFGGTGTDNTHLDMVEAFDLECAEWLRTSSMLHETGIFPISAKHKMLIFAIVNTVRGNSDLTTRLKPDLQMYSTLEDTWTYGAPLPDSVSKSTFGATAICYKDALYLVGGSQNLCCRYSIDTNMWSMLRQPTIMQSFGAPLLMNQSIMILGGIADSSAKNVTDIISEYNIEEDSWKVLDAKCPVQFKRGVAYITDKNMDIKTVD